MHVDCSNKPAAAAAAADQAYGQKVWNKLTKNEKEMKEKKKNQQAGYADT